jgi:hypothetical protein
MNDLEERIDELEMQNEELLSRMYDLESRLQAFIEPCAIGHEQLWKIVREDIQGLPVPNGPDLRDMI